MIICQVFSQNTATGRCKREGRKQMTHWLNKVTQVWGKMKHVKEQSTQDNPFCRTARAHRPDLLSFSKETQMLRTSVVPGKARACQEMPKLWVQSAISTRCLLCQKMMFSPVTVQQSVAADAWSISAPSLERGCFLPRATDEMLQWQQKSGQVQHMPFWSGRKALVIPVCSLWTSTVSTVIISLLFKSCHWAKKRLDGCRKVEKVGRRKLKIKTNSSVPCTDGRKRLCKVPSPQKPLLLCKGAIYLWGGEEMWQRSKINTKCGSKGRKKKAKKTGEVLMGEAGWKTRKNC